LASLGGRRMSSPRPAGTYDCRRLMPMKFTLLGCGTSTGVPVPGCCCRVCSSEEPRNSRLRTSAVIRLDSGQNILVDAGPDLRQQSLQYQVRRVDAVLYTHSHADHILGTDDLRSFNFISGKRIPCYGTGETLTDLRRIFTYIFEPSPTYQGGMLAQLDLIPISPSCACTIHGVTFSPFILHHGQTEVLGFRIGDLGYATDFKRMPDEAKQILRGVKHLFIDGLRYEQHATHATIPEALALIEEIQPERAFIIHTSHSIDYHETNAKLPAGVELAWDGLTVLIS
jgi:phosphoribosyl 1,2-cyclic phosphate phosphodiesterase